MLEYIFNPKSIALIGASRDEKSLGFSILSNVAKLGFAGDIYPVNPKATEILGLTCYVSVLKIPKPIDLAVIMVPAKFVAAVLTECGKKNIKGVIIISAGFKEIGAEGLEREKEIQSIAKKYQIKLIGPNCLGIMNPHIKLNASFADGMPAPGKIGLISQSGAMAVAILDWAYQSQLGFSKIISIGNKAGLTELDLMKYLAADPETKVIVMYLESITNGWEFMKLADKITNTKPIIVLKAGTTAAGSKAISSHTGSLAGSNKVVQVAFKQCGVVRAKTVEDLFDFAKAFASLPLPKGNRVAIITNAGGPGIMTTDAIAETKLKLAEFSTETKKILLKKLPATASVNNPVDIIGDALLDRYEIALKTVLKDPNVDSVVVILTPQTMTQKKETAELVAKLARKSRKPIIPVFMGGDQVNVGRLVLKKNKIPNYAYGERAIRTLDKMYLANWIKKEIVLPKYNKKRKKLNFDTSKIQLKTVHAEALLREYGIPTLPNHLITKKEDLKKIDYWPIALKIASRDIIHKKDSQALAINIQTLLQAEQKRQEIINNVKNNFTKAEIEGVLAQPMAKPDSLEIIIGMKRDENFGPVIMFGLGGSYVELLKDVSFRLAPLNVKEAIKQIQNIKTYPILKKYDINLIIDLLIKISHLALDYPQIQEIDLNPVMLYKKGGVVVDARMML